ncbi:DUF2917 domain-containing protein [Aquabacterium sp. A7-Y]|uniref:DUF2917 domain-containing protein n=1 Tax=Aquabacterium sp. A7-Y TaxID=1349605 RepID=UPI00223D7626|nr:DUF2917 domain-containing protein [Aquabacterium sp. A7-Y]MCW7540035.1 DUF2917 domain-containing protein [Aquabacterium sp. A7-Y]
MRPSPSYATLQLAPGQLMHLPLSRSATLEVRHGRVWVTASGDLHDHFLHAGDSLQLRPGEGVLLGAESGSAVALVRPASALGRLFGRLSAALSRTPRPAAPPDSAPAVAG